MRSATNRHVSGVQRIGRRSVLLGFAAVATGGLAGCSLTDDSGPGADPTETPSPTETPEVIPSPTQDVIASPVAGYADPTRWEGRTLTIAAWGGDYQDAQQAAFFDPFAAATGATVQVKVADIAGLRSQVDEESVTWDLMTLPLEQSVDLAREGYLAEIAYDVVDATPLYQDIVLPYAVGASYFSTIMIYPAGSTNAPNDWSDFWDAPPIPEEGEVDPTSYRCLQRSPIGTLEFALLADGVPIEELYPLDVERAFASLDRLRENVLVWWQESKEPIELVAIGQVGLGSGWNVRISQLEEEEEVRVLWYGGMLSADAWVVPHGAPNRDIAMDFINYATRAVPSANFARLIPYGPVNPDAFPLLTQDRVARLPSAPTNKPVQFLMDFTYWASNRESLTERFEEWLLADTDEATPEPVDD